MDIMPVEMISVVAKKLVGFRHKLVYTGGAVTGLMITRMPSPKPRFTNDVDVIVQATTRLAYYKVADELRALGLVEDRSDNAPICRWIAEGVKLDVMPLDAAILGFTNRWYAPALAECTQFAIDAELSIDIISATYFLATKLDAFASRGSANYQLSKDIEDIVSVIDGRIEIVEEFRSAQPDVQQFVAERFKSMLDDEQFIDSISWHLLYDEGSQARRSIVEQRMKEISELAHS